MNSLDVAGAGPSDASSNVTSQNVSLCPSDEPSASQDTRFAQRAALEDDIVKKKQKKPLKIHIKLVEILNE